jgi:serine phosphatase RsbU (regulator of sigma subunit)
MALHAAHCKRLEREKSNIEKRIDYHRQIIMDIEVEIEKG